MLEVMREVRNFFVNTAERGTFTLTKCSIKLSSSYLVGQYILVTGSVLNDGLYKITRRYGSTYTLDKTLTAEAFTGTVYGLRVPSDFISLCAAIDKYNAENTPTAIASESSGGYSISMATDDKGQLASWQSTFSRRLMPFRRMFADVSI